ncbi:hypothetical protein FRC12_025081 [Ceratobasidium sp. 428]|nr:hypothetical protein FRC12_025081 [Ceratobasidium sp. 428]
MMVDQPRRVPHWCSPPPSLPPPSGPYAFDPTFPPAIGAPWPPYTWPNDIYPSAGQPPYLQFPPPPPPHAFPPYPLLPRVPPPRAFRPHDLPRALPPRVLSPPSPVSPPYCSPGTPSSPAWTGSTVDYTPPHSPCIPNLPRALQLDRWFSEGDLTIHAQDGRVFMADRAILELPSKRLADLVKAAINNTLYLSESSGAIRALLSWAYPQKTMHIEDFDTLDEALTIAKRYRLGPMLDALRSLLTQPDSPVHMRIDPVRAYHIAVTHDLMSEAPSAAMLAVGKIDFRDASVLDELKFRGRVSVECAFKLAQRQLAWECALTDCLLRTTTESGEKMILEEGEWKELVCAECVSWDEADGPSGLVEWQRNWAEKVFERLIHTPFEDCAHMFRPEYMTHVWSWGCERCMIRLMRNQNVLDAWMRKVWELLDSKWTAIFEEI